MTITYETNAQGERVKVTTNGRTVIRELDMPPLPVPAPHLTHLEFLKRLTPQEFKAIRQAAKSNADVDMWLYMFERAQDIDLANQDTIDGLNGLEAAGLLAAGRAAVILG